MVAPTEYFCASLNIRFSTKLGASQLL
uniref:Uncharacterized protein n=1 Tax=Tetranychus urticae TaxID=32264 RepID=T1JX17_TETUR